MRGLMSSSRPMREGIPLKYQMWETGVASSMWPMRSRRTLARGDFHAAAVADLALVADLLILAAVALPVLRGAKDALAEQAVALGLEGAVVDGLGLFDLAVRPFTDHLRRSESDFDRVKRCVTHFLYRSSFSQRLPDRRPAKSALTSSSATYLKVAASSSSASSAKGLLRWPVILGVHAERG